MAASYQILPSSSAILPSSAVQYQQIALPYTSKISAVERKGIGIKRVFVKNLQTSKIFR
jgi:hypothetical protein